MEKFKGCPKCDHLNYKKIPFDLTKVSSSILQKISSKIAIFENSDDTHGKLDGNFWYLFLVQYFLHFILFPFKNAFQREKEAFRLI